MRGPAPIRRGSYAAAIALLVLAQLGAMVHAATVRHVRCAAHGELVETAVIAPHATDVPRLVGVESGASHDDHCELAASIHHDGAAPRAHVARLAAVWAPCPDTAAPCAHQPRALIYLFAPKTSPPDRRVFLT